MDQPTHTETWQTRIRRAADEQMKQWARHARLFRYAQGARKLPRWCAPGDLPGERQWEGRRG